MTDQHPTTPEPAEIDDVATVDGDATDDVGGFGLVGGGKHVVPTPRLPKHPLDVNPTRGITSNLRRGGAQDDTV